MKIFFIWTQNSTKMLWTMDEEEAQQIADDLDKSWSGWGIEPAQIFGVPAEEVPRRVRT